MTPQSHAAADIQFLYTKFEYGYIRNHIHSFTLNLNMVTFGYKYFHKVSFLICEHLYFRSL